MLFEQFTSLDINIDGININILNENRTGFDSWFAAPGYTKAICMFTPFFDSKVMNDIVQSINDNEELLHRVYTKQEKNEYFSWLYENSDYRQLPEERKKMILAAESWRLVVGMSGNSGISIHSYTGKTFTDKDFEILIRFAKVFHQTYTRFLDLQKAEMQAKEASIEAALERVRSKTMAMHNSNDLLQVINILAEQLRQLGFNADNVSFITDSDANGYNMWLSSPGDSFLLKFYVPRLNDKTTRLFTEAKEQNKDFYTYTLNKKDKDIYFKNFFENTILRDTPPEERKTVYDAPGMSSAIILLEKISLAVGNFSAIPYSDEDIIILKRFAKVFQQSYTRFLDLQRAESQALDAIKRASVDRIRAEIASMRTTRDLERIQPLIWNELKTLGIPFIRCGVFIMDEEKQEVNTLLSTPDGKAIAAFRQAYNAPGEILEIVDSWRKKKVYKQHWDEVHLLEFAKNLVQQGAVTSGDKYLTDNRPADLHLHFLPFLQGMLYVGNTSPLQDSELQLVQNLADAFSTAYARYEDFNRLEAAKKQVDNTLNELQVTQKQLIQSEKMASLGELTAGIAHEIQNPLNFVNNFSEVSNELITEMVDEIKKGNTEEVKIIVMDLQQNLQKIIHHGKRADSIVKGMLQHSRIGSGQKEPTNINALADEYLRLAYHGLRAKDKSFNVTLNTDYDDHIGNVNVIPQDIGRVVLNLVTNAFYVVSEKSLRQAKDDNYEPTVSVSTKKIGDKVLISVKDNGNGIPQSVLDKIFQPFFTTKPTGQGTGLGLSLSYDIIKAHGGEIKVNTKEARPDDPVVQGEGSEFIIQLPTN